MSSPDFPRSIRAAQEPLGLYFRPAHNDHRLLCQLLSEGKSSMTGVVFDATFLEEQEELRIEVNRRNLWSVLDHRVLEISTTGGLTPRRKSLPWASERPYVVSDLQGRSGLEVSARIADFVAENRFSAVFAPTHYLEKGYADPWLSVDRELTAQLRKHLDARGCKDVALHYPLALPTKIFFDPAERLALKHALQSIPTSLDGVWFRIHPFGGQSGHVTLQRYILAARDFHDLKVPLLATNVGAVGSALIAFGAVSGLEIGVSSGESFDIGRLAKTRSPNKGFSPHRRVLIGPLGIFLDQRDAKAFFENKSLRANYACRNTSCCRQGASDMVENPRRHFAYQRMDEISMLGQLPPTVRPNGYLDHMLRPSTDKLGRVIQADIPPRIRKKLERDRRKLDGWRGTLGQMVQFSPPTTLATVPTRRAQSR